MNINLSDKKILRMTLQKVFFDLVVSGKKNEEYRNMSTYWVSRLLEKNGDNREYDYIEFKNGYAKNAPTLLVEWKGTEIELYEDAHESSENPNDYYFVILLGNIIAKYNLSI